MTGTVLFVYGTLRRGQPAHGLLAGCEPLGPAATEPAYRLYDLGPFPGLVPDPAGVAVEGELYRADADALARLDAYEGDAGLFARGPVALAGGGAAEAYFFAGPVAGRRDCGRAWPPAG